MENKLVTLTLGVVVAIIVLAVVLIPALDDARDGQTISYTNAGYSAKLVDGTDVISYTWDATNGITIGSEKIPYSSANGALVIIASDSFYMMTALNGATAAFVKASESISLGTNVTGCSVSVDPSTKTISVTNITASTTIADFTIQYDSWCAVPSVDGNLVMYNPYVTAKVAHLEKDSQVYSVYRNSTSWFLALTGSEVSGSVNAPEFTTSFDGQPVEGYDDLYSLSLSSTPGDYYITVSDTNYAPQIIVMEKLAVGTTETGMEIIPLLMVIPLLIIIAILVVVVRNFLKN